MANNVFTGTIDNDSTKAGNWSLGVVPSVGDGNVVLMSNSFVNMTLNADLEFDDLNVTKSTGTLTITDGGGYAIKVYNSVSKSNNGSITFNCNFYVKGGSVNMSGSGYFNISSGKYFYFDGNTTIGNINIGGVGTVKYLSGTITHSGDINIRDSINFDVNGDVNPSATTTSSTGINWNKYIHNTSGVFKAELSPLRVVGNFTLNGSGVGATSLSDIYIGGNFNTGNTTSYSNGTIFNLDGTGTITINGTLGMSLKFKATSNYTFNTDISFRATIYSESGCNVNVNSKTIVLGDGNMHLNAPHIQFYRILHTDNTYSITLHNNLNVDILEFNPVAYGYTVNIGGAYQLNCKQFIIGGAGGETVRSNDITINVSESLYIRGDLNRKTIGGIFTLNLLSGATQDVRCNASYVDSSGGQTIWTGINNSISNTTNWGRGEGNLLLAFKKY